MDEKNERVLTCIRCPRGCRVRVGLGAGGSVLAVTGNACPRGDSYARAEVSAPVRTVTTTVPVEGGSQRRVAVKTAREVPRDAVLDVVRALAGARAVAPVEIGDVIARDVAGTGVDVVATGRA
ncbi:DUF1667 domain-containing protein [Olsenella sp. An293]|uniref:DUF1667 domain-containing protein n=1 Tax=Olsenella sp. An293 TaxID=1965626 RepID=UPI000B38B49C|nr:DUF1667 domain-containing protein [Olsenella sp. An293]OUO32211.1 molybdopterin oxidoreductase [Olsenella sp. An293]